MSSARKLVCLALCALVSTVLADDKPCTIHDKGRFFDLTPLKLHKDYNVATVAHDELFPLTICQPVKTETFGVKDSTIGDQEIASFIRRAHGDFVIGKVNTTLSIYENRPRLVLSGGSKCKSSNGDAVDIRASTVIDFVCDAGVFGPGQPRLLAQLPPGGDDAACGFVIEWKTHYACPIGESGLVWTIFVFLAVVFLALLTAYTVLGTLYNRYVLQLRGFDQIPQFSVESMKYHSSEAVDWLRDVAAGLDIPGNNTTGGGGFGRRPSNARGANSFSHQAQAGGIPVQPDDDEATVGFSRPLRRQETNPISHQTQVIAETQRVAGGLLSFGAGPSAPSAPTPPPQLLNTPVRTKLEVREATPAERQYMLGDDDDEEDEDEDEDEDSEEDTPREETPSQSPQSSRLPPQGSTQSIPPDTNPANLL